MKNHTTMGKVQPILFISWNKLNLNSLVRSGLQVSSRNSTLVLFSGPTPLLERLLSPMRNCLKNSRASAMNSYERTVKETPRRKQRENSHTLLNSSTISGEGFATTLTQSTSFQHSSSLLLKWFWEDYRITCLTSFVMVTRFDFVNTIQFCCCVDEAIQIHYDYFSRWMGFVRQNPGEKTGVVPIMIGYEGAGKSLWASEVLVKCFGPHGITLANWTDLLHKFGGDLLEKAILVAAEEVDFSDEKMVDLYKA